MAAMHKFVELFFHMYSGEWWMDFDVMQKVHLFFPQLGLEFR